MQTNNSIQGKCLIFSAPSGAGKTSIVRHLLNQDLNLAFSVSACSREPRVNEVDGKDYIFLGVEGFKQKIQEDAFIEWEEVYENNFYGTLKSEIKRIWSTGKIAVFDVDVEGGINLKKRFQEAALSIFVRPPSIEILEARLRNRNTETEEKIQMRLAKSKQELEQASHFDVILLNDNFQLACNEALMLVKGFIG